MERSARCVVRAWSWLVGTYLAEEGGVLLDQGADLAGCGEGLGLVAIDDEEDSPAHWTAV